MSGFSELANKKVLGVPALYVAGAFVVVLAIVAWRMQASAPADPTDVPGDTGVAPGELDNVNAGADFSGLATNGSVVVTTPQPEPVTTPTPTNDSWAKNATGWIISKNLATPSAAQTAVTKYVMGQARSYEESQWVDAAIKAIGLPPDPIAEGGTVTPKGSQRQFTKFPGVHTIKGDGDNGFPELARLYYQNASQDRIDLLQSQNTSLGENGPWAIGTKVRIPGYHAPVYFTVPNTTTRKSDVTRKYAIAAVNLDAMNTTTTKYSFNAYLPKGLRVRVS